jgi:hypothetical protein
LVSLYFEGYYFVAIIDALTFRKTESRLVERAKIFLLAADGVHAKSPSDQTRWARVSKWRRRFAHKRLQGLVDERRSGKPASYDKSAERRVRLQPMERRSVGRSPQGCEPAPGVARSAATPHLPG